MSVICGIDLDVDFNKSFQLAPQRQLHLIVPVNFRCRSRVQHDGAAYQWMMLTAAGCCLADDVPRLGLGPARSGESRELPLEVPAGDAY